MKKVSRTSLSSSHLIYTSDINSPMNSAPQSECFNTFRVAQETQDAASIEQEHEGEIENTLTSCSTTNDVFFGQEDRKSETKPEAHDASSVENKPSEYLSDLIIQMTADLRYFVSHCQHGNKPIQNDSGIMAMDFPAPYTKEDLLEERKASNKNNRRSWKGVRRQVRNLLRGLCCCLLAPSTEVSTSR